MTPRPARRMARTTAAPVPTSTRCELLAAPQGEPHAPAAGLGARPMAWPSRSGAEPHSSVTSSSGGSATGTSERQVLRAWPAPGRRPARGRRRGRAGRRPPPPPRRRCRRSPGCRCAAAPAARRPAKALSAAAPLRRGRPRRGRRPARRTTRAWTPPAPRPGAPSGVEREASGGRRGRGWQPASATAARRRRQPGRGQRRAAPSRPLQGLARDRPAGRRGPPARPRRAAAPGQSPAPPARPAVALRWEEMTGMEARLSTPPSEEARATRRSASWTRAQARIAALHREREDPAAAAQQAARQVVVGVGARGTGSGPAPPRGAAPAPRRGASAVAFWR